jgi:putative transcriptional regulator
MANHPNRGKRAAQSNPSPEEIIELRHTYDLTQSEAAALVYSGLRTWQDWESGERRMHPAIWELFCIKVVVKV